MLIESGLNTTGLGSMRGQFLTAAAAWQFIRAGKGVFTLESVATGARFTYRVSTPRDNPKLLFVKVMAGSDNSGRYTYLGYVRNGRYTHGKRSKIGHSAGSVLALRWALERLVEGELPKTLRVWHEGRCGKCYRRLTVPASVYTGFGPECSDQLGIDWGTPVCESV